MKIHFFTRYCWIFGLLFFLSCFEQKEETDSEISVFKRVDPGKLNISLVSTMIKLETTDSCLMGGISQIEKDDSIIFILDTYNKLYAFNCEGQFLNKIGGFGNSPSTFVSCPLFCLDKKRKVLLVVDNMRFKIVSYTYEGKYVSTEEIQSPEDMNWCSKGLIGDDGNLMIFRLMNPADNFQYVLFDAKNNYSALWKRYSYDPLRVIDHAVAFSKHPMTETKDGIHFIKPLCDTVFQYSQGRVTPAYVIELPLPMLPKELFTKELDIQKSYFFMLNELAGQSYFPGFSAIFETSTHVLIKEVYMGCYYLADKKEKKGFFKQMGGEADLTKIGLYDILSCTENEFIGAIDCETLLDLEEKTEDKSTIHPELKKILAVSEFDDNPCLVFYRF